MREVGFIPLPHDHPRRWKQVRPTRSREVLKKFAIELQNAERGLAKACGRLRIPLPPRGFWAKVQAGQQPLKPQLPELKSGQAEEIVIRIQGA